MCQSQSLVTIWIFSIHLFDEKFKLWLDAFVCSYMPKILAFNSSLVTLKLSVHHLYNFFETRVLNFWCLISIQTLLFWATSPTRQDGSENREKDYYIRRLKCMSHKTNLSRLKYELYSAHEKWDVRTRPNNIESIGSCKISLGCYSVALAECVTECYCI